METITFQDYVDFASECRSQLFQMHEEINLFNLNNSEYNPNFDGNWYSWKSGVVKQIECKFLRVERKYYLEYFNVGDFEYCRKLYLTINQKVASHRQAWQPTK